MALLEKLLMEMSYKKECQLRSFYCNYILVVSRMNRSHWSRTLTFQKKLCYLLHSELFKNDEKIFYFILKTLFILNIFKFLSLLFGHAEQTAWLER